MPAVARERGAVGRRLRREAEAATPSVKARSPTATAAVSKVRVASRVREVGAKAFTRCAAAPAHPSRAGAQVSGLVGSVSRELPIRRASAA